LILDLHLARESGQCAEAADRKVPRSGHATQPQKSDPELRGEDRGKRPPFWSFDPDGGEPALGTNGSRMESMAQ
jgi:hypothetical protein